MGPFSIERDCPITLRNKKAQALLAFLALAPLASYGIYLPGVFRPAAEYVDRILKGERPGNLPAQQPTTFQFVINPKTAKALDLIVPPDLRANADQVIE
jgi:putative ABC transport system substrate-binding protein